MTGSCKLILLCTYLQTKQLNILTKGFLTNIYKQLGKALGKPRANKIIFCHNSCGNMSLQYFGTYDYAA